jgi:hypothetical protein
MSLDSCPFDPETGLFVARTEVPRSANCNRCKIKPWAFLVHLKNYNRDEEKTLFVCPDCLNYYQGLKILFDLDPYSDPSLHHPSGCFSVDQNVTKECLGDGHYMCKHCARFEESNEVRSPD